MPYIGPNFHKDSHRLMFVGIETYCNDLRKEYSNTDYGKFSTKYIKELFIDKKVTDSKGIKRYSPFWGWVNSISTEVLSTSAENAFTRIAYSNLNKCQSRKKGATEKDFCDSPYRLTEELSRNCIQKQKWIYQEIIAPEVDAQNIIVFAGKKNDYALARLFLGDGYDDLLNTFTYEDNSIKRKDLWIHLKSGHRRIIITNHPQFTPDDIRRRIIKIIQNNVISPTEWPIPKLA